MNNKQSIQSKSIFRKDNLCAWCIIPYDKLNRNATERAQMLNELGITKLAYDWRTWHLPYLTDEIRTMRIHNIDICSVWFWNEGNDVSLLDQNNITILETIKNEGLKTNLWVSFPEHFFQELSDDEKLTKAVKAISRIHESAAAIGCSISLYNHGGWYGDLENQIKIIKTSGFEDIGIAYNFFRGVHDPQKFKLLLKNMLPYLKIINLNGLIGDGPETWNDDEALGPPYIVTIGDGDREQEMMKIIQESEYNGLIGILGHTAGEDVKVVLKRNLDGLEKVVNSLLS